MTVPIAEGSLATPGLFNRHFQQGGFSPTWYQSGITSGTVSAVSALQAAINAASAASGTVRLGAGVFLLDSGVTLLSNVRLVGEGEGKTIVRLPQSNVTLPNYSMFKVLSDISNVVIDGITFQGNASAQTTTPTTGLDWYAFYAARGVDGLTIRDCRFTNWGVNVSPEVQFGGPVVVFPSTLTSVVNNIRIEGNRFDEAFNVCGAFVGIPNGGASGKNVFITGNSFAGGGRQNCVYVAAGEANTTDLFDNVVIQGNTFSITSEADVCIEVNGVRGLAVTDNVMVMRAPAQGILIRRAVDDVAITGNAIAMPSTATRAYAVAEPVGITVLRFLSGQTQKGMTISNNAVSDFSSYQIQIDAGSDGILVANNFLFGRAKTPNAGVYLADCRQVVVQGNVMQQIAYPVRADSSGVTMDNIAIRDNVFLSSGTSGGGLVQSFTANIKTERWLIEQNVALNTVAGTSHVVNYQPAASGLTNEVRWNYAPGVPNIVNPSHAARFTTRHPIPGNPVITTTAPTSGVSSGETGELAWNSTHLFVCTSSNSWSRATLNRF